MLKGQVIRFMYTKVLRPILFLFNPELVHDSIVFLGKMAGETKIGRFLTKTLFSYENPKLAKNLLGINFPNPVGLAAGFDYNANLTKILPSVGFGFFTVGTVTNKPYEGNPAPRLVRLPKSKSILVNKGFKSEGATRIIEKLNDPFLENVTFGVSVGSSNIPEINTTEKAIADIAACFEKLKNVPHIKYYELNISCPNLAMGEGFAEPANFSKLLSTVLALNLNKPIFIKMPNEGDSQKTDEIVHLAVDAGVKGFVFSNLAKARDNPALHPEDRAKVEALKGNMSGKPTWENSNNLIRRYRNMYGNKIVIVGCGGVFSPNDAKIKFESGADLIQLITGMVYEGPSIIGLINRLLSLL